jgi:2-polyprenyl-3-methyl-5-hydroxy-6-metoxy-1,4-benzoquinol methylase
MMVPDSPSLGPNLNVFTNYDYEIDLAGETAGAFVVAMVGKNKKVLEIGAGSGAITRHLVNSGQCDVVALEVNPESIAKLKDICQRVYSGDLNDPTWPEIFASEEGFDVIVAADVLEHLYDPWTALKGMKSLLREGGFIVLSLPHVGHAGLLSCVMAEDFGYGEWGLLDKTHIRFFGIHNIQTLHENAGLDLEEAKFVITEPENTEFAAHWNRLPEPTRRALLGNRFSKVYQVVTKSAPAGKVKNTIRLIDEPALTQKTNIKTNDRVKLIAFYLTQFHPTPENDEWWGRGFTEWTNTTKATPLFPGHYQPHLPTDLGFYDLRLRQSRRDQIEMAKAYGVDGFCYHYYWFSGRRILNAPLDDMLADPDSDMPFCLCWANENWTRRWDAAEHEILIAQNYGATDDLDFIKDLVPIFSDKRYIRINGAPFFIVYRPQHLPDAKKTVALWREYCASVGIPKIHVACAFSHGNWDHRQYGFDSGVEFPPHNIVAENLSPRLKLDDEFNGYIFDYKDVADLYLNRKYDAELNGYRTVFPSWDNTARTGLRAALSLNGTPQNYEYWLAQAIQRTKNDFPNQERLVFINAWNEWAEGCHLEPCRRYGRQFLEATMVAKSGLSMLTSFPQVGVPAAAAAESPVIADTHAEVPAAAAAENPVVADTHVEVPAGAIAESPVIAEDELSENAQALSRPKKQYSKLGLFLRQKVRTPVRAALNNSIGPGMNHMKSYFRRFNLAIRGRDDHRLIRRIGMLAALADERGVERDQLVSQLAERISERDRFEAEHADLVSQRDQLSSQRDELFSLRDQLISQRDEFLSQRDHLGSWNADLVTQNGRLTTQINGLAAQASAISSVVVERDRMAAQLAETVSGYKDNDRRLLTKDLENLRARYLDLMESTLIGAIYKDPPFPTFGVENFDESIRERGLDWPKNAFSMIGTARMRNFRTCLERAILSNVPGDIVETGVWRGGASILARAVLAAYGVTDRKVILADSFEGLPPPDKEHYPADADSNFHEFPELAVSLEQVRNNFEKFGLLDDQVVFLKGWFKDTMPHVPAQQIAVLRLDGDMYESTIDPLTHLFDRVSVGGWVIVDDYEWVPACKAAVDDFLSGRGLKPEIQQIDGVGVFFQKSA